MDLKSFWTDEIAVGEMTFTPLSILIGILLFVFLIVVTGLLKKILRSRVLPRIGFAPGVSAAVATLLSYGC